MNRKPYPSDATDEQWLLLEPLIPLARPGGRPREVDIREVVNALFYRNREAAPGGVCRMTSRLEDGLQLLAVVAGTGPGKALLQGTA